mgnify:FL=1
MVHIPVKASGRRIYSRHQRRIIPDEITEPRAPLVPERPDEHVADMVGILTGPVHIHVHTAFQQIHAYSG